MHFVILAKDKSAVDQYLNETVPLMLENPNKLQQNIEKKINYKVPIWFSNIHPNEIPATDSLVCFLDNLATKDILSYDLYDIKHISRDEDTPGKHVKTDKLMETVTLDVNDALNNIIFLFHFTTNPDGRDIHVRQNSNNFDLNRDCVIQSQPESRHVVSALAKWRPTIFLEHHGFYQEFVIAPPCTPPHDPNVEYDLILPNNLELAKAMGMAGISNTSYAEFQIPNLDLASGWDDISPNYTDYYVQSLGAIGSIIEIPDPNNESKEALKYANMAAAKYLLTNKDRLFMNQLEIYKRGILGLDEKEKVDSFFIDENKHQIGRPRGTNINFFPEYYVIPVDESMQKNVVQAYGMVERLIRSGIKVSETKQNVTIGNKTYPKGSFVVDMHQATRGLANNFLYDGLDVSEFGGIYSENVISLHHTMGFDRDEIRVPGIFDGKLKNINQVEIPWTEIIGKKSAMYVIRNSSNDAVKAVNKLLNYGHKVEMLLDSENEFKMGDYIVSKESLDLIKDDYLLSIASYNGNASRVALKRPTVAVLPAITSRTHVDGGPEFALREMGFEVLRNRDDCDVIVATSAASAKSDILDGKSYIGLGKEAMAFIKKSGLLPGFDFEYPSRASSEGLLRSKVAQDNPVTAIYNENKVIYNVRGGHITGVPDEAKVLTSVSSEDDFFIAGYWPSESKNNLKGSPLSISAQVGQANITIFANNITFRALAQDDWRMLANAIFISVSQ